MEKKIIIVDQAGGRKFLVTPGPDAVCPDCVGEDLASLPPLARICEFFDAAARTFSTACARCGRTLAQYPARELDAEG